MKTLTDMPKYEAYKDSGVDWIGDVPESWDISRLGAVFEERRTKVSDIDYPPLSVTKNGILPQLDNAAKTKDGDNRKLVLTGDFVINSRSDRKGSSGVSCLDGSVSLINIVLKPKRINPSFCNHLLKCNAFIEEYYRVGRGIVADLWTTRYDEMRTMMLALPSLNEQTAIANFLDEKTAKIDEAIAIKEKQIELLKERKQIIIQQAVTQGLDPTVPMKDSGVEWIGMIPAHWEVKKIKHLGYIYSGDAIVNNQLSDEGLYEVFGGNGLMGFCDKFNVTDHCIIIGRVGALCGNIRLINERKWISDNALILKLNVGVNYKYIADILVVADLNKLNTSNAQPLITGTKVLNHYVPIAPVPEQQSICDFIELIKTKYSESENILYKQIVKLKEYKTTLINSAVTGKIKVV